MILQTGVAPAKPYPVMFYIHGGDFDHGSSNTFHGHMMAAFYNVVVVAINYRLGALGNEIFKHIIKCNFYNNVLIKKGF